MLSQRRGDSSQKKKAGWRKSQSTPTLGSKTPIPRFTNVIRSKKTVCKVKIYKLKINFKVKDCDWFLTPIKITQIFFPHMLEYYTIVKIRTVLLFYDGYFLFNPVKYY
jgi:hypothetical protein